MDDLLALMEGGDDADAAFQDDDDSNAASAQDNNNAADSSNKKKTKKKNAAQAVDAQADNRLGIRMMQRNMGSLDLFDYIASRNFHSPATLAGMSLISLNQQVLVEPAAVVDIATVCGRTNLLTIGLVFSNSGTKIASSGKAFCFLTIGSNISSGPSVSVMLFGPAYSKYCQAAKAGLVVALEDPRLIPPNTNKKNILYDTAISFSINDERQLSIIAQARDYGVCQAMVKGKNAQGQWVNNLKRCSTVIDTRVGKYCHLHRKLENVKQQSSAANKNNNQKKGTFMQQQRQQKQLNLQAVRNDGTVILPNNKGDMCRISQGKAGNGRLQNVPKQMVKGATSTSTQQPQQSFAQRITSQKTPNNKKQLSNNRFLNPTKAEKKSLVPPSSSQSSSSATLRPTVVPATSDKVRTVSKISLLNNPKQQSSNPTTTKRMSSDSAAQTLINPYTSKAKTTVTQQPRQQQQQPILQNSTKQPQSKKRPNKKAPVDWLNASASKKKRLSSSDGGSTTSTGSNKKKSKASLNTIAMGGFDGQVPVPKPSKIFAFTTGIARNDTTTSHQATKLLEEEQQQQSQQEEILANQRRLAQQLKGSTEETSSSKKIRYNKPTKKPAVAAKSQGFFDTIPQTMKEMDREAILNAKSRFATEADAEAYAASRRRLTELEQKEARKEASSSKKKKKQQGGQDDDKNNAIGKEWICKTCNNKKSSFKPKVCIRAGHKVEKRFKLNKAIETKDEKRTKLNSAAVEDGGITLGSGLAWSRFPSSRFS